MFLSRGEIAAGRVTNPVSYVEISSVEMGLLSKLQPRIVSFTVSPTRTLEKRSDAIEHIRKCSESSGVDAVGELQRVDKSSRRFAILRQYRYFAHLSLIFTRPKESPKISLGLE